MRGSQGAALAAAIVVTTYSLATLAQTVDGRVTGTVTDALGRPVAGAQLHLQAPDGRPIAADGGRCQRHVQLSRGRARDLCRACGGGGFSIRHGDRHGGGRRRGERDDRSHRDEAARPRARGKAARDRAAEHRAAHRRLDLHALAAGDREPAGRRECAAQPDPASGAGRRPGFLRMARSTSATSTPTSSTASTASSCRRASASSGRASARASPTRSISSPGRLPAQYGLRTAGDRRHPDQERRLRAGRLPRDVWRKPRLAAAERGVRRLARSLQLLRRRRLSAERHRHRESDLVLQRRSTTTPSRATASPISRTSSIPTSKVSVILGTFRGQFQIPNSPRPDAGFTVNGNGNFNSRQARRESARTQPLRDRLLPEVRAEFRRAGLGLHALQQPHLPA